MGISPFDRLKQVVETPDGELDLAEAALLVAKEQYPNLDLRHYLATLITIAARARTRFGNDATVGDAIFLLNEYLFDVEGFGGKSARCGDPRNHFLNEVIDHRCGSPLTLAVLYIAVGRCLGLPLEALVLPNHVLVQLPAVGGGGAIVLDPYAGGVVLDDLQLRATLAASFGEDLPEASIPALLLPTGKRGLVLRMLREIKAYYISQRRYDRALWFADHILHLAPDETDELRSRATLYEQIHHARAAVADYRRYLELVPRAGDLSEIRRRIQFLQSRVAHLH